MDINWEINSKTTMQSVEIINECHKGKYISSLSYCCDNIYENEHLKESLFSFIVQGCS